MELGICTFGDVRPGYNDVPGVTGEQRLSELMEEVGLADDLGLDVFAVGEHHRPDYAISAPAIVLAAAAVRTKRVRLTSAVTVLSSEDPVRVFQNFATIDLLSHGRAEVMAGRGSFTESFPLFGCSLDEYDALFDEKINLLLQLRESERVTWSGKYRPALKDQAVYPRPVQSPLPVWIGVGGNPPSVIRAARLGLPLMIAIIGGEPARFRPLVELYREAARRSGREPSELAVGINSHGFIAEDARQAADDYFPYYAAVMTQIGRERGWPPMTRQQFDALCTLPGALAVGTPEQIVEKILYQHELFRHDRYLMQMDLGAVPHDMVMHSIELFATKVAPVVREALADRASLSA